MASDYEDGDMFIPNAVCGLLQMLAYNPGPIVSHAEGA